MAWPNDDRHWRSDHDGEPPEYDIYLVSDRLVLMPHRVTGDGRSGVWIAELCLKRSLIYCNRHVLHLYRRYNPTTLLMWAMTQVAEGKVEES